MQNDFSFSFKGQNHEAFIIGKDTSVLPTFVFIHGAGTGSKERIYTYSNALAQKGITMLSFDQSGAGADGDNIRESSLQRRTEEAVHAIEKFASRDELVICGSSMGGEVAIRLLQYFPVKALILFAPAIYDEKAFSIKFGEGFTEVIRRTESWKNSEAINIIEGFKGRLLIIIGEQDEVIPTGVIDILDLHSVNTEQKEIYLIPDCPHKYQQWVSDHPEAQKKVSQKILEYAG